MLTRCENCSNHYDSRYQSPKCVNFKHAETGSCPVEEHIGNVRAARMKEGRHVTKGRAQGGTQR